MRLVRASDGAVAPSRRGTRGAIDPSRPIEPRGLAGPTRPKGKQMKTRDVSIAASKAGNLRGDYEFASLVLARALIGRAMVSSAAGRRACERKYDELSVMIADAAEEAML